MKTRCDELGELGCGHGELSTACSMGVSDDRYFTGKRKVLKC